MVFNVSRLEAVVVDAHDLKAMKGIVFADIQPTVELSEVFPHEYPEPGRSFLAIS